jgi:hypothetical protein
MHSVVINVQTAFNYALHVMVHKIISARVANKYLGLFLTTLPKAAFVNQDST